MNWNYYREDRTTRLAPQYRSFQYSSDRLDSMTPLLVVALIKITSPFFICVTSPTCVTALLCFSLVKKTKSPGFNSFFIGCTLYNAGKHIMPTPGRFEGQHFVTLYPRQWQHIIWEIPERYFPISKPVMPPKGTE